MVECRELAIGGEILIGKRITGIASGGNIAAEAGAAQPRVVDDMIGVGGRAGALNSNDPARPRPLELVVPGDAGVVVVLETAFNMAFATQDIHPTGDPEFCFLAVGIFREAALGVSLDPIEALVGNEVHDTRNGVGT